MIKRVRLAALRDSPRAFAMTYDSERRQPDDKWKKWAEASEEGESEVEFLAFDHGRPAGMVAAFIPDVDSAQLIAMWVSIRAGRRGAGRALAAAVIDWAAAAGKHRVGLRVADDNDGAIALAWTTCSDRGRST